MNHVVSVGGLACVFQSQGTARRPMWLELSEQRGVRGDGLSEVAQRRPCKPLKDLGLTLIALESHGRVLS